MEPTDLARAAFPRSRRTWVLGTGLATSMALLALAPLFVPEGYSVVHHTLSEAGGQGVDGAWVQRSGVILAAGTVLAMTWVASQVWQRFAIIWVRIYVLALFSLVAFPEAPWDGGPHDLRVAMLHTVAGVCAASSFIVAVLVVSAGRPRRQALRKMLDWVVVAAITLIPQIMLVTTSQGLWQRVMVTLGYAWLFAELSRMTRPAAGITPMPSQSRPVSR